MDKSLQEYFHCASHIADFEMRGASSAESGFFRFGSAICYGPCAGASPAKEFSRSLPDASENMRIEKQRVLLPFDLSQIIDNLRHERYVSKGRLSLDRVTGSTFSKTLYYSLRPGLPVFVRKHLQRARLRGWDKIPFPRWPVDFTVDSLMGRALALAMKTSGVSRLPFVWFWPEGAPGCAIMTHDVEQPAGRDFCGELMDLDDAAGIKSAFQVVPEVRYGVDKDFVEMFRRRGFEVNVHDLNHDGKLFQDKAEFLRRAERINEYAKEFGTRGFRAGAMYRNQEWYGALDISYDMSVPNVAHLEPQRGGCCTVMPYFIGNVLELPLTATQDYSLFHIIGDYSIELWKRQIEMILERNGLISFIVHPDYVIEKRARAVYVDLLAHLARVRAERKLWIALPSQVDRWWRNRREMKLVKTGEAWRIEGPDKERARIAHAVLDGDRLTYEVQEQP